MSSTQAAGKSVKNGSDSASILGPDADQAREKLVNDLKGVISEAEEWLHNAGADTSDSLVSLKEKFETTLRKAKNDLVRLEESVVAKTKQAAQATDDYVQDNPWTSVGVGAVVGVLVGLLIARR
ncbi:DUF883 family protein [Janthinobacterium agaricidamnosum]|uniref:DUF883 domain-containing protein n=1 Tax=Janthinobacterium agaricidamnosum NBRC 102515 = DSM 9628 TaxID=1349767 RepID=W0VCP6_9BURK|nr:DUF883 family protein [Janthinobacterium agaricidamnosum]CDG85143.1 conserved hypothetical protein [Janthinobacterium agaricidamnosum NBRC 102515 = DSM 9628]